MKVSAAINEGLKENVILLVAPAEKYKFFIEEILASLTKKKNKLCIVSLNKSYHVLTEELKKKKINLNNALFIDGSPNKALSKSVKNISTISSPQAYTEINIETKKAIKKGAEHIIFDSLSHSLIYGNHQIFLRYIHDLMTFVRDKNKKIFFIILESDYNQKITKKIEMLVDKVFILGEEVGAARIDATNLLENLFGPQAGKLAEKTADIKKAKVLLEELKSSLSQLVGPENAQEQMQELFEKYSKKKNG